MHEEPTIDEILREPIVLSLMAADGVGRLELETLMRRGSGFHRAIKRQPVAEAPISFPAGHHCAGLRTRTTAPTNMHREY